MTRLFHALLLVVALSPLGLMVFRPWRRAPAGRRYPTLVGASWLRFGVTTVLLLGVAERWPAFGHMPAEFAEAQARLGLAGLRAEDRWVLVGAGAIGVAVGIAAGTLLTAWRAWVGRPEGTLFGDAGSVRPARGELGWGAAVAVTAGVTEEAYFRLLLPLLATLVTGSAVAGFAGATLMFGLAHRYQGWRGVVATAVAGAGLAGFYLATENLVAAMAIHAAGDLGHLVIRPAVRGWIEERRRPPR